MSNIEYIIYILIVNNEYKYNNRVDINSILEESKNIKYGVYNFSKYSVYKICILLRELNMINICRDNGIIYVNSIRDKF